ncbi:hypothetical protein AB656_06400 [Bifidobacterium actinocoloniiforme DSM 22766]|nr:hypothetical protein AB656_06400 [Bifidobacterium actinocoloniiforme DSM 22766]
MAVYHQVSDEARFERYAQGPDLMRSAGPGLLSRLWPDVDGLFLGRFVHDSAAFVSVAREAVALS